MSTDGGANPRPGDVLGAVGEAASQLGSFATHLIDDQPATALCAAVVAGFIAGGGLASPIGTRMTSATIRATLGNVATLVALDLLRRALDVEGTSDARAESARPK
jgi:hypothetical protein